jgi:hypothetical protein
MGGVSNKTTSHITLVLDLTYFSRSQGSMLKKHYESWQILLLFDLECCSLVSGHPLHMHQISAWSEFNTWHNTPVFYLTYFSRSQRSKFETNYEVDLFCYFLTWKVLTLHERVSRHHLHFSPIRLQILEKQLSAITPKLMPGSSPNFNHS